MLIKYCLYHHGKIAVPTHPFASLQRHILKPKGVAIAVLSQYGVMPLTAFSLAKVSVAVKFLSSKTL